MNFRNWCDVDNFPGIREFNYSHAVVEEVGQTFWHNAPDIFKNLDGMLLGDRGGLAIRSFGQCPVGYGR